MEEWLDEAAVGLEKGKKAIVTAAAFLLGYCDCEIL
jgi:hypothetical protein